MDKIKQFLKGTKIASRILFVLWLLLAIFGNFANESKALEILDFTVFFLLPAIVNELCKNPIFRNRKDKFFLFVRHTKVVSRVLFQLWALTSWVSLTGGLFVSVIVMSVVFLLPIIGIERKNNPVFNPNRMPLIVDDTQPLESADDCLKSDDDTMSEQLSEETKNNLQSEHYNAREVIKKQQKNRKRPLPTQAIGGTILCAIGGFLSIALLMPIIAITDNEFLATAGKEGVIVGVVMGLCGVVLLVLGIFYLQGRFVDSALAKREQKACARRMRPYKGVYLTEEQIHNLENEVVLPIVDTPVFLNYGEVAVWHSEATRQETKNRVIGRTGSYSGGTVRIAKGLSIHTGGNNSKPIYGDVSMQFHGEFVITNERIIFLSNQKGFEIKHANITAATAYKDGFSFQSRNTSYVLLVPRADLATLAFDGVRTGEIPIAGINTSFDDGYDDFDDDYDEIDSQDVSSIDGMDGHDFEYFCADILRKNDFSEVSVTKGSGDQGVDILATKGGIKYAIQCKNYASPLSNTPIQEVNAGKTFYNCHVGVVMTNSTFTPGAKSLAQATGVLLWDRTVLQSMMESID